MSILNTVTVTHQNAINYGAVLQAYALQQHLLKLGVEDQLLDIKRDHKIFNKVEFNKHMAGNIYANVVSLFNILRTRKRVERFKKFVKENLRTTRYYKTFNEVLENPPVANVYITGSDQTFNTRYGIKPHSFLKFGSEKTRRISYASSMGTADVQDIYLNDFVAAIKTYSFLSAREQCAAAFISKTCGVPCATVIDPTLLRSKQEWQDFASSSKVYQEIKQEKYILVYFLLENQLLNETLKKLKEKTNLRVIVINPYAICRVKGDCIIRDAGPLEFLSLYKDAEYVLTTSFHGTCFSILFEKPFFSFIRKTGETRITNILNKLNLSDRIVTDVNQLKLDEISYDDVNKIVEMERKKANDYLIRALGI